MYTRMIPTRGRHRLRLISVAGGASALLLLASCGNSPFAAASDDLSEADKSRLAEQFRDCMAEGGLDAEVSYSNGGLDIAVDAAADMTEERMLEIEAGCESILNELEGSGGPELSPDEQAELADGMVDVQRCLADKGYVVDLSPDGGISIESDAQPDADNWDEEAYLAAEDECFQEVLPELYEKFGP